MAPILTIDVSGEMFNKYNRRGRAKYRKVWFNRELDRMSWGVSRHPKPVLVKGFIDTHDIETITLGTKGSKDNHRSFTVVTDKRTVNLEASDIATRDKWVTAINFVVDSM